MQQRHGRAVPEELPGSGDSPKRPRRMPSRVPRTAERAVGKSGEAGGYVGFGIIYEDAFRTQFATGAMLQWEVVFPDRAGGNLVDYLYLTAMNRAALGLEAHISFCGQDEPTFEVFDWARPDGQRNQVSCRVASLPDFVYEREVGGTRYRVLGILNTTVELQPGRWRNEAHLFSASAQEYRLQYGFDYDATLPQQHGGENGWWGPVVELFTPPLRGTRPMGCADAFAKHRDANGVWSDWVLLSAANSRIRDDDVGCQQQLLDPNHSFIVTS